MIRTLGRVLAGFALACVAAGLLQLLFAKPPSKFAASASADTGQLVMEMIDYALLFATHTAIFSAAFALIAAGIGEWTGTRAMTYYLFAGTVIALLGFSAQFASEAPGQPTVLNNYALKAFLTSGFFAGLVYWMVAGRKAGGAVQDAAAAEAGDDYTIGVPPPARTWKTRPKLIIEDSPKPGTRDSRKASLAERLAVADDMPAAKDVPPLKDQSLEKDSAPAKIASSLASSGDRASRQTSDPISQRANHKSGVQAAAAAAALAAETKPETKPETKQVAASSTSVPSVSVPSAKPAPATARSDAKPDGKPESDADNNA